MINALFPYFSWKEEIEVYKYHKSTIITVFTDMGISITIIGLAAGLAVISPIVSGIVSVAIVLILSIVFYLILMKVVSKKLENLEI